MNRKGAVVQIEGARELRRQLKAAGDDLKDLSAAHRKAADIAARAARTAAPVKTGRLAGSIRASGTKTAGIIRAGRKAIPYANPIEFGWAARGIKAHPFLTVSAKRTEPVWVPIYMQELEKTLDKVKGK
ncbi:HK97 gp10 family phage protein [Schaalia sp. ZJ1691]|uniref:HK97 gp10 family phage protein n=1 Tax=Schaalia sp. ZJ1691 TaxID=2709404 RepID=UPI0013EDD39A|nr:HK97 gp10 family phage protein [Schaalia sp. ZJ1691]